MPTPPAMSGRGPSVADEDRALLGRAGEQRALRALITAARNGLGGTMIIRGDPGIGKTALVNDAVRRLPGVQLVRLIGFEAESAIPFAGLQRFLQPLAAYRRALPAPHHAALDIATGAIQGPPPDRFLVGLGVLGLLAEAGQIKPVVCAVDEAHWLDPETLDVLAFVARRLQAEAVAMIVALRDDVQLDRLVAGLPALTLTGLDLDSAVHLLVGSLPDAFDPMLAARIARSTAGNPLALLDLAHDLSLRQLAAYALADEPIPVGHHLEAHYVRQAGRADPSTRRWLLAAAADSTGNLELIAGAAHDLGLDSGAPERAEDAGLVVLGSPVRFRHPLVRSAVYNAAPGSELRRTHAALSNAAARLGLVELDAWHAAKSTIGVDARIAGQLEQVADRAGRRGGFTSRARVLARAAELSPPGAERNGRLVSAAEAALAAGGAQLARELLDGLDPDTTDRIQQSRATTVEAALAMFTGDATQIPWACATMLRAADAAHGVAPELEQAALVRAFEYCLPSERLTQGVTLPELGRRLEAGADVTEGPSSVILRGLAAHILRPYAVAVPLMRLAVNTLTSLGDDEVLHFGAVGVALTTALWDHRGREAGLLRNAEIARSAGSLQLLDSTLWTLSLAELSGGTPRASGYYIEQVRELRRALGYEAEHVINAAYLAWIGAPRAEVEAIAAGLAHSGFGGVHAAAVAALAQRDIAEGEYAGAYQALQPLVDEPFLQVTPLQLPDFVEAAVRGGHPEAAPPAVATLETMADANGSAWNRGVALRSRALIQPVEAAEGSYRTAVEVLTAAGTEVERGRALLVYGEWLRRRRRRSDAREQLGLALESLAGAGAVVFAQRARTELTAIGVRVADQEAPFDLTGREATVARLAAAGQTNAEIGATLFISANTVDYHLRKVFQKLGISSRRQLTERLPTTA